MNADGILKGTKEWNGNWFLIHQCMGCCLPVVFMGPVFTPLYLCWPTDLFRGRRSSVSEAVQLQCAEIRYFSAVA